jgi:tetratricopeptide (TPR) repeat protein
VTAADGAVFGIVGALAAFPRRLAARAVETQGGTLRRGVGRQTTHVVLGRRLLARALEPAIEARVAAERDAGRTLLGEGGFLRMLGLAEAAPAGGIDRRALIGAGLTEAELDLLALFDAFEHDREPWSFRDLILARKYAGLRRDGASWSAIARSVHRFGPAGGLAAETLHVGACRGVLLGPEAAPREPDGQLRLDLGPIDDPEELFAAAEAAEAEGRAREAADLYRRCLAVDPGDALAAFNRANCLRALGEPHEAARDYLRAAKLDRGFVEAWFNLGCLAAERGAGTAARRHFGRALALDPGYADAVYNLAALEFDEGRLDAARGHWLRYLALDPDSDWGRRAAKGVAFVDRARAEGRQA